MMKNKVKINTDEAIKEAQDEAIDERKQGAKKVMMVEVQHPEMGGMEYPMIRGMDNSISHTYSTKYKGSDGKPMCRDVRMSIAMKKDGKPMIDSYSVDNHEDWDTKNLSTKKN